MSKEDALLDRAATLAGVGDIATFAASNRGHTTTATEVDVPCGASMGLG